MNQYILPVISISKTKRKGNLTSLLPSTVSRLDILDCFVYITNHIFLHLVGTSSDGTTSAVDFVSIIFFEFDVNIPLNANDYK